jgi:hypothetical protein
MANYKESSVAGITWQRCHRIDIRNPHEEPKFAVFLEEEITDLGNEKTVKSPVGQILADFTDPSTVVDLINPETSDSLGTSVTYQDIYVILYSLYIKLATERDAI